MRTSGQFLQDSPFTDGQIFLAPGIGLFRDDMRNQVITQNNGSSPNNFNFNGTGTAYNLIASLNLLNRTGIAPNYQEQFGTAASLPGPSSVANTSDPLNLVGMPPTKKASLATLTGGSNGYVAKGAQFNWIDLIYSTGANALGSASIGISLFKFANNAAPVQTTLLAFANNGLPIAAQVNPFVARVTPTTQPGFIITSDTVLQINIQLLTGATGTLQVYGAVLGVSYNFN